MTPNDEPKDDLGETGSRSIPPSDPTPDPKPEDPLLHPEQESALEPMDRQVLANLGERLVKACRHAYEHQGLCAMDVIWVLHGIMGRVVEWGLSDVNEEDQEADEDDDEDDDDED